MLIFVLDMRYLVTFRKRFDRTGEPDDAPQNLIDVADGVVEDCEVVETIEPYSIHASEDISSENAAESAEDDGVPGVRHGNLGLRYCRRARAGIQGRRGQQ